jgi:snRNA-activating protein complex subunit 3
MPAVQELLLVGSQFLTDLRDNIYCLPVKMMELAGQHGHSGYYIIVVCFSFL